MSLYNISKIYQVGPEKRSALKNITLNIQKGEFVSISGPSGSGKTTLMEILSMISRATFGKYVFEEKEISLTEDKFLADLRNQKLGFVFERSGFIPEFTCYQNLELPLLYRNISPLHRREKVMASLQAFGLIGYEFVLPKDVNRTLLKKMEIARTTLHDPSIIFADEPTGELDSVGVEEIMAIFQDLNRAGKTIVLVTHDIDIARHGNRVVILKDGQISKDVALSNPVDAHEMLKKLKGN